MLKSLDEGGGRVYDQISHAQRIHAIYLKTVHCLPLKDIQVITGVKYNTLRNILRTYCKCGRTNRQAYSSTAKKEAQRKKVFRAAELGASICDDSRSTNSKLEASGSPEEKKANTNFSSSPASQIERCGLALLCTGEGDADDGQRTRPTRSSPERHESPAQAKDNQFQKRQAKLRLVEAAQFQSPEVSGPEAQQEMASSNIFDFENCKDSAANYFSGALAFINKSLITTNNERLQLVKMAARQRFEFRSRMKGDLGY